MGRRRWLPLALAALSLAVTAAAAASVTGMRVGGVPYAPADAVARALGDIVVSGQGSLTWRTARGTLTVFADSPDALWQESGASEAQTIGLSAPVLLRDGGWWLPLDALDTLGVRVQGADLLLPDGTTLVFRLPSLPAAGADGRSQVDELGNGVPALRLFAGGGDAGAAGGSGAATDAGPQVAALLADLDMLPLVDPSERAAIDQALEGTAPDKPLMVVVTALQDGGWQPTFTLSQGGRSLEFRYPYRMRLVGGSPSRVGPDAPASMLLLLPAWFNLYRPITVSWQGVSASITFRR
ncbi:MAG TPA: hypothetical protein VKA00_07815 [Trueperaceae bacterium]|nr:hypothetical protein [Trueperaceae bacterium]